MKITLISPKGPLYRHRGGIFKKNLRYAPLTLSTLAAYVPQELNATIEIIDEGIEDVDLNLQTDLIGMTVITGSSIRAYELSAHFRRRGIPVVLGGPHITLMPEDAQPHADAIVTGYAEDTWPQLLRDFAAGQMKQRYTMPPDLNLANRPFPKREMMKKQHYLTTHVFEATRACVHSCEFCVSPAAWGIRPYFKPVEDVIADIKQHWARKIIFIDLNLISDKEYAARLFEAMIPLKVNWFGLSTTLLGKDDALLSLAARSGCTGLLMGFESITPANLRQSKKGFNHPDEYKELIQKLHRYGITLMACFTFGMDNDTTDVFMQTSKFAIEAGIDLPRYAIVTPFPNTGLYKRLESEGRILTKNWELYDAQHVVFQPKLMTPAELYEGHEKAWKHTYSATAMATRYFKSRIQTPVWWIANMGYRFYAHHLKDFYNCDWILGQLEPQPHIEKKPDLIQLAGD
jgi:radical SAM superfamily enzyme YgiQ (UPF0313 family)